MKNESIRAVIGASVLLAFGGPAQAQLPVIGGLLAGGGVPGLDALSLDALGGSNLLPELFSAAGVFSGPLEAIPFDTFINAGSPLLGLGYTALPIGELASAGLPMLSPLTINALEGPALIDSLIGGLLLGF